MTLQAILVAVATLAAAGVAWELGARIGAYRRHTRNGQS